MSETSSLKRKKQQQHIVGVHYSLGNKIGEGSFGIIFEGMNLLYNNSNMTKYVAIKFEPKKSDTPQLKDEYRSYKILKNQPHVPKVYYYGQEGSNNILIIDLLGPSLEDLFEWCGRQFSIKTCTLLAIQMIDTLKTIHANNLIYRDIKPDNFLIAEYQLTSYIPNSSSSSVKSYNSSSHSSAGKIVCNNSNNPNKDPNYVYIVDFGMAKQYRDPISKQHIPYREKKSLSGTARYMSINTHLGKEQSRRDDLESLAHVFFYFLRGQLPWQGLKAANNKLKYEKIGKTKQASTADFLCMNGKIPWQFGEILNYARSLKFEEEPDYDHLIRMLYSVFDEMNIENDGRYDWMDLNGGRGWDIRLNKRNNLNGYGGGNTNNNLVNNGGKYRQQPTSNRQRPMENLKQIQKDTQRLENQQQQALRQKKSIQNVNENMSERRRSEELKAYYLSNSTNNSLSMSPNNEGYQSFENKNKMRYSRMVNDQQYGSIPNNTRYKGQLLPKNKQNGLIYEEEQDLEAGLLQDYEEDGYENGETVGNKIKKVFCCCTIM
ncbi:related to Casein kinase I homolog 3 [Hanseniaspora guilliermondii]|uniref:non-specific serine/threonine protein kinase n=1 Tax=Hanseniaspora guilliermondii TaxID=56406 RepID=A0A1L0B4C6_9ASCO|nr:related to Casein kinase I homolog 3 [Hanseniaspora guilliermondii]